MAQFKLKQLWVNGLRKMRDGYADTQEDISLTSRKWRIGAALLLLYLFAAIVFGIYWSRTPPLFDVRDNTATLLADNELPVRSGTTTTATLILVAETLLDKPGGYLGNDIAPPGVWLDNVPNWEYGALVQIRDLAKAMRESFSRSQSQSREDVDLILAEPRFNFDNDSWIFPASESQYREAIRYLHRYQRRLANSDHSDAQFFARADNLNYWLATVETRLGNLSQRLSASVGQQRLSSDAAGTQASPSSASDGGLIKTPWSQLDDVLFEARGSSWALIHFLRAAEIDFADVLADKNATVSLQQIIRELEATQQTLYSPIILNGSGFGLLPNHSLVMASYISRANAAIIDLRRLLNQG
jgi:hypothetical protein